jgi:recombination associated protein RdgC
MAPKKNPSKKQATATGEGAATSTRAEVSFLGREFLTWLWFRCEAEGGEFDLPAEHGKTNSVAVMVEDALSLVSFEEDGSVMTLRKGSPTARPEAASALAAGMLLKKARIFMAQGPREWQFTLDAETLDLGGLKTPELEEAEAPAKEGEEKVSAEAIESGEDGKKKKKKGAETDALDDVSEKLLSAEEARDVVEALFKGFLDVRLGKDWEKSEFPRMCDWVGVKLSKAAGEVGLAS